MDYGSMIRLFAETLNVGTYHGVYTIPRDSTRDVVRFECQIKVNTQIWHSEKPGVYAIKVEAWSPSDDAELLGWHAPEPLMLAGWLPTKEEVIRLGLAEAHTFTEALVDALPDADARTDMQILNDPDVMTLETDAVPF